MADNKKPDLDDDLDTDAESKAEVADVELDLEASPKEELANGDAEKLSQPEEQPKPEEVPKPVAEATAWSEPTVTPIDPAKKGIFVPAVIGGIVAASLGFFAARSEVLDGILPEALKSGVSADVIIALQDADAKQAATLAALGAEIATFKVPDLAPLKAQIESNSADIAPIRVDLVVFKTRLETLEARLNPLGARLEALEKQPMTDAVSDSAIAAYEREMTALKQAIATQRADVEKMMVTARATEDDARALEASAATTARQAEVRAIVTRLHAALDSGGATASILAELAVAGISVPEVLNVSANKGVATLAALADAFPAAARSALSAVRAESGGGGGIGSYLQRYLGARSVEPREGDDPDAILSRAEAALTNGQLAQALDEIAALPEVARAEMQPWTDLALTRLTALQTVAEMAQSLNSN